MATPDQDDRGRCASCGFLAVTAFWSGTPTLRAIDLYQRDTARLSGFPGCFVQAADLSEELREGDAKKRPIDAEPGDFGPEDFAAVISRERNCPEWFRYQPGLSPEQHLDRKLQMQLELERREHELRLTEMEQESRASQAKIADAIKASSEAIERTAIETKSFTTKWTYIAVVLAGLAVMGTIAAALIAALGYWFPHAVTPP